MLDSVLMDFFSTGDIVTVIIVIGLFMFFRFADKKSRNIQAARNYGKQLEERLKEQISKYIEKKKNEITDYGAILAADKSAAKAVLANIESKSKEFSDKSINFAEINKRLSDFSAVLSDIYKMTDRVDGNLRRIAAESEFVENAVKLVSEAKEKYGELLGKIEDIRGEIELNADSAIKAIGSRISLGREEIENDFILRKEKIENAEKERSAGIQRDSILINTMLKEAVDNAGERAGRLEGEIYEGFKKQSEERAARIKSDIDSAIMDIDSYARNKIDELEKNINSGIEELRVNSKELKKSAGAVNELEKQFKENADTVNLEINAQRERIESAIAYQNKFVSDAAASQEKEIKEIADKAKNSAAATEAELKLLLESAQDNIKKQIASYEGEALSIGENITSEFKSSVGGLKSKLREIETEIEKIKKTAFERTEENLRQFEDDFASDLSRRSGSIESRFVEWREALNARLNSVTEQQEADCRRVEAAFSESLRKKMSELDSKLLEEAGRVGSIAQGIEREVQKQSEASESAVRLFSEQIKNDIDELRAGTLKQIHTEIGRSALETGEKLKNSLREIENEQKAITDGIEAKNKEIDSMLSTHKKEIEDSIFDFSSGLKDISAQIENIRGRGKEVLAENKEKIDLLKKSIDEINEDIKKYKNEMLIGADANIKSLNASVLQAEEKINSFMDQSKLIDKTMEMKDALARSIDDLKDNIERVGLQKADLDNLESRIVKLKRMEDEANLKMARFANEQRRIDLMEEDFNKLLHTSASVDEKLSSLSENNDVLQEMQLKLKKISEALAETEDKYQRIEKKNQILDATNEGIDKNFKMLQESEKTAKQFVATVGHVTAELTEIKTAVESLMQQNSKALEASEKLGALDSKLSEIEARIGEMQKARQWLADIEGRINSVYAEAKGQVKIAGELLKKDGFKNSAANGAPTLSQREQVISLKRQGWKADEISRNLKISQGAVELILEMETRER